MRRLIVGASVLACSAAFASIGCGSSDSSGRGGGSTSSSSPIGGGVNEGGGASGPGRGGSAAGGATANGGSGGSGGSAIIVVSPSCESPSPAFTASEQKIVDLPADTWFSAASTKLRAVCPDGFACNVIDPWSGGAYDANHNLLFVFGGGHVDYSGNELYAFDLASLRWTRLTDPSSASGMNQDPLPDGQPVSRHTYDGLQFLTHANRFFAHGGSRFQDGSGTNETWSFEVESKKWTDKKPAAPNEAQCCAEGSVYDPVTKKVYAHLTKELDSYDYDANAWTKIADFGDAPLWPRYENWGYKIGVLDAKRRLAWFIGGGAYLVWDIDHAKIVTDDWASTGGTVGDNSADISGHDDELFTSGGTEIWKGEGPGVDYDPTSDSIVGWDGGGPWVLDLASKKWAQKSSSGAPNAQAMNGTYGRFRYVPRLNVFILVNGVDDDVVFYKHTAGCGK
jgi:hypothetical protein